MPAELVLTCKKYLNKARGDDDDDDDRPEIS
jgi:hypothetical protein